MDLLSHFCVIIDSTIILLLLANFMVEVITKTKVSTRTKVLVAVGTLFLFAVAAYGFTYWTELTLPEEQVTSEQPTSRLAPEEQPAAGEALTTEGQPVAERTPPEERTAGGWSCQTDLEITYENLHPATAPYQTVGTFKIKNPSTEAKCKASIKQIVLVPTIKNFEPGIYPVLLRKAAAKLSEQQIIAASEWPLPAAKVDFYFTNPLIIAPNTEESLLLQIDVSKKTVKENQYLTLSIPAWGIEWQDDVASGHLSPAVSYDFYHQIHPICKDVSIAFDPTLPPSYLSGALYARLLGFKLTNPNSFKDCVFNPTSFTLDLKAVISPSNPKQLLIFRPVGTTKKSDELTKKEADLSDIKPVFVSTYKDFDLLPGESKSYDVFLDMKNTQGVPFEITLNNTSFGWSSNGVYYPSTTVTPSSVKQKVSAETLACEKALDVESIPVALVKTATTKSQLNSWPILKFKLTNISQGCTAIPKSFVLDLTGQCDSPFNCYTPPPSPVTNIKLIQGDSLIDANFQALTYGTVNNEYGTKGLIINFKNVFLKPGESRTFTVTANMTNYAENEFYYLFAKIPKYVFGLHYLDDGFYGGLIYSDQTDTQHFTTKGVAGYKGGG
ncbi:hypothetical protein EPN90_04185 [Patescibacteria group bacterium]|nr:MAG: hypothetical protein EPN90_04185 [Patescibacteria group bacterium]